MIFLRISSISRKRYNINILAVKNEGEFNIAISPDTYLAENNKLLVLGEYRALQKCFRIQFIYYEEAAKEVKAMAEGMLAVTVFCMFGIGFYIANKADQFLGEIQENAEEKLPRSQV